MDKLTIISPLPPRVAMKRVREKERTARSFSYFPFRAQRRIRFTHRARHKGPPSFLPTLAVARLSPMGRRAILIAQPGHGPNNRTSSSGIESVLELTLTSRPFRAFRSHARFLPRIVSIGMFEVRARFYRRVESSFFIDVNLFIDATCRHSRAGDKTFDNYINHSKEGGGVCCSKERTIALRFSNVTRENRSRGYQSVISHDIGERYSRNRGRDRLFMQLQRGLMFPETMRKNNDVRTNRVVGSWQKSRFIYIWGGEI